MQFTNPTALWALGLIPVLIIIHNLRSRPRQLIVTNLFLWREIINERNRGLRVQHVILRNLTLLLQIIIIILASLALAKPISFEPADAKGNMILVLDTSASMQTRTESGTRFDRARAEALKAINNLAPGRKMFIIESSYETKVLSGFSDDKNKLKETIQQVQPTDTSGQLMKSIYMALSFVEPTMNDNVIVITDGGNDQLKDLTTLHQKVKPILITGGQNNLGITQFEFRQVLNQEGAYEIMLEVANFNPHPVICPVRLFLDETPIFEKTIGLRASEKRRLIVPYAGLIAGTAEARLDIVDDFPIDNSAYSVLRESQDIWVLLVSKGNYFLEKLLEAYPDMLVNSVQDIYASSWETQIQGHDIVIIDQTPFPAVEKGSFLIIDSFSPSLPLKKINQVDHPVILDWNRNHPVMTNLDLRDLRIETASQVSTNNSVTPLLESEHTGLIYAFQNKALRIVFIGFDINQSDLPLRTAFPVMMSNILQWLYPDKLRFSSAQIRAGETYPVYVQSRSNTISIRSPSGKQKRFPVTSNPLEFRETREVGLYRITEGDRKRYFAVNLTDTSESNIRPPSPEEQDRMETLINKSRDQAEDTIMIEKPLWFLFLIAVVGALLLEGYVWLRNR